VLRSQVRLSGRAQSSEVLLWGREAGPANVNVHDEFIDKKTTYLTSAIAAAVLLTAV